MRDSPGKHTPYFELLEAQDKPGCPICRMINRATDRYLDSLLYEAVLDPDVRAKTKATHGFCADHVEMLGERPGRALGIALIYRDIIRAAADAADRPTPPSGKLLDTLRGKNRPGALAADSLRHDQACPACLIGREAEVNYTSLMLAHIEDPEFHAAYAAGEGICLPHLIAVLERAGTEEEVRAIVGPQVVRYRHMLSELDEFIRKRDHRFRHEPMGEEGDVWLRAMNAVVGGAGWGLTARSGGRRTNPLER
ncbi:MAG: hypothetical protein GXY52_02615 [Chloroflexi bacterium]|nr:hypothetical protein [Chloroflexota bacterium]